jgi:hypothetical protein
VPFSSLAVNNRDRGGSGLLPFFVVADLRDRRGSGFLPFFSVDADLRHRGGSGGRQRI